MSLLLDFFRKNTPTVRTTADEPDFYVHNFGNSWVNMTNNIEAMYAYMKCPPLSFCLMQRSSALKNAKIEVLKENGDYATSIESQLFLDKLNKPNEYESWGIFRTKIDNYVSLYGWCLIYADNDIIGYNPLKANNWHVLSPLEVEPVFLNQNENTINNKIVSYRPLTNIGVNSIPASETLLIKSDVINANNRYLSNGIASTVSEPISNVIASLEARNSSLVNRGAVGVVSRNIKDVQEIPLLEDELAKVKTDWFNHGLTKGKSPLIFANIGLKFDRIEWSIKDLMAHEEEKQSSERIFDAFSVPFDLVSNSKGSTFENQYNADKRLYENFAIPTDRDLYVKLTKWCRFKGESIQAFYDHLTVFQESEKDNAEAKKAIVEAYMPLYEKGIITKNRLLELLEEETIVGGDNYINNEKDTTVRTDV